jgi:hypothetical protein
MSDVLKFLSTVPGIAVLVGLLAAAFLLVTLTNWRLLVLALGAQYLLLGLMLTRAVPLELSAVKALVGVMICPVLYITARRVRWGHLGDEPEEDAPPPPRRRVWLSALIGPGLPVRALAASLTAVLGLSLALRSPLPIVNDLVAARDLTIGTFGLVLLGLLNVILNENPLKVGIGLLTLLSGFELFYTAIEPTLTLVGLLGLTNLIIALAISYLTTAWATHPPREVEP